MKANITGTGQLSRSQAAFSHIDKLIAGLELANVITKSLARIDEMDESELKRFMSHYTGDRFSGNLHTQRGNDCEPNAIAAISELLGVQVNDVGMCVMGDSENGVVSCSPDGLVFSGGKLTAGVEVKSPCLCNWLGQFMEGVLPADYKLQVHAGMAICDVDAWHFGSYFEGKPIFYVEVKRDGFTDKIQKSLLEFQDQYRERRGVLLDKLARGES